MASSYRIISPNAFPRVEGADTSVVRLQVYGERLMGQPPGMEIRMEADEARAMAMVLIHHAKAIQRREMIEMADKVLASLPEEQRQKVLDKRRTRE